MATARKENKLTKLILEKSKLNNIKKSLLEVDYMANHILELTEEKQEIIKNTIKDINKTANKKKFKDKEYLTALNDNLRGKLFYLAYKEGKYFKMADIEKVIDKKTIIEFIKEIETSQDYAWELIENIQQKTMKDFFYGIFTYLYF